jgi:hypothetical protein
VSTRTRPSARSCPLRLRLFDVLVSTSSIYQRCNKETWNATYNTSGACLDNRLLVRVAIDADPRRDGLRERNHTPGTAYGVLECAADELDPVDRCSIVDGAALWLSLAKPKLAAGE